MKKAFKFRIYPTKEQIKTIDNQINCCRYLYNQSLNLKKVCYEYDKSSLSKFDIIKIIPIFCLRTNVFSQVLQNVIDRLDKSFKNFFRRVKNGDIEPGFPRFKGKNKYHSITYPQHGFKLGKDKIYLSTIGNIPVVFHRSIEGKIKTVTLTKYHNRYFISIVCEIEKEIKTKPIEKIVALDLGIKHFAYSSDNKIIENPRFYDEKIDKIKSKIDLEKDKKRKTELKKRKHTLEFRNNNKKDNFIHQTVNSLLKEYDCIITEDLDIKNMLQSNNSNLNKQINTVSWSKFTNCISYKVEDTGKKYIKVDPKNTTKMCSKCFRLVEKSLSERTHKCSCGLEIDRDYNASLNILRLGLQSLGENP